MRWLADENIPRGAVSVLRARGEDVVAVCETSPGMGDRQVLALAVSQQRILLTCDRDHGDLIFSNGLESPPGVVYLRVVPGSAEQLGHLVLQLIDNVSDQLADFLTVVTKEGMRQRRLPDASG